MRRMILMVALLAVCPGCRPPIQESTSQQVWNSTTVTVLDVRFPSSSIGSMLWYRAILPAVAPGQRLPVLYLLHGINSSPSEIMERSDVVRLATVARLIVVMPEAGYSYYTNAKHKSHSKWEDAITVELPRDVKARLPLLTEREHTGIAGISMGGYAAVKLALKHPELYSFAGTMSGALDITRRPASLRRWGQNDPLRGINQHFVHELRARGAGIDSVTTPSAHDWNSWNAAMPELLRRAAEGLR
jgi:S-formylglutathione hydrolase FrmB